MKVTFQDIVNENISRGKCVVYIKSAKEADTCKALIKKAIGTRSIIINEFVEDGVSKRYKPVLEKAISKCNERAAKLVIANIGHLPRSLAFCNACMQLEGDDPYIIAIRSIDHKAGDFNYHVKQMYFQCIDHINATSNKVKKSIAQKKLSGWKAGNPINLEVATDNATRARERLADDYCKVIIPEIRRIQRYGKVTLQEIANALMAQSIKTRRGKDTWTPMGVSNVLNKAKKLEL